MKNILVLAANYPDNNGGVSLMYIHTRNKQYLQNGIQVTVLNFTAKREYSKDGINVITYRDFRKSSVKYDTLLLHSANIRNHYRFLKKYGSCFEHFIFFFHGHEILYLDKAYPKPYDYMKTCSPLRILLQKYYDFYKITVWKNYLPRVAPKADFIFVSRFLYNEFKDNTGLDEAALLGHVHIIPNCVGPVFEEKTYNRLTEKKYNYITIRNMLDESVYCIDLLCKVARSNPDKRFLLIGKGLYFEHYPKPENIDWINTFLNQNEMLGYIDQAEQALMLTQRDSQGVMSCELIAYGIPLLTSDIPVCHEIFDGIPCVDYIDNSVLSLKQIPLSAGYEKCIRYSGKTTIPQEIELILKTDR